MTDSPTSAPTASTPALTAARAVHARMVAWRRQLHEQPEIGLHLPATADLVRGELEGLGLDVETDAASSGLTAVLPGTSGQTVILRADMDALPIEERTDVEFRSRTADAMHACGHDLHTAMLLGAARALADQPQRHTIVLAFQSGEEFDRGALPLLEHKHLRSVQDARTFALHLHAQQPAGTFVGRAGAFMAYGDWFEITVTGASGHASSPHLARSPIPAASFLARQIDSLTDLHQTPWPTRVATVTQLTSGNSVNVIPDQATLRGTLRGHDEATIVGLRDTLDALGHEVRQVYGVEVSVDITQGYPAVINDASMADYAAHLARDAALAETSVMPQPSMVIEDYAYFLQRWPGAMTYLGAKVPGFDAFNHSAEVMFDEAVMVQGCAFHIAVATDGALS
jgi:amidohydrolase